MADTKPEPEPEPTHPVDKLVERIELQDRLTRAGLLDELDQAAYLVNLRHWLSRPGATFPLAGIRTRR